MKNYVLLYNVLLHHLSSARRQFAQNIPVPKNDRPKASSLFRETLQIFCSMRYFLLSLLPLKSNILVEKTRVYEYAPQLLHSYLSLNQILPLFYKITVSLCHVLLRQGLFSYILGTIPNGICSHKQHDLCFLVPQGYYINVFPIEGNTLMRFSSPTKGRSIQSRFT